MRGVVIRGVLPQEEPTVSDVVSQMRQGSFDDLRAGEFNIVLGTELARELQVESAATRSPDCAAG